LTGPVTRGDLGTMRANLDAVATNAPRAHELYVAAAPREIDQATGRGILAPELARQMADTLDAAVARAH
jgi:predicted short-subunit dehydrogenase-like oxidoreductase (DUF2520 family)